ncbi:TlpA disulfide reductase family protein [Tessaracoccus sp. MC1756]|uniref:TlpA family protein disulfide reductase n=1 Tax=Tessaracoccus sp. MC1756 TaxID=2760311 RepID=UPI0015FF7445|nr:TlpA disulfide reductase family protein [Tessaracoccus sp. MC1756]MBB1508430.1 TlpA family protein disulfide reductase [Tessaracoccus sp. MC1756]
MRIRSAIAALGAALLLAACTPGPSTTPTAPATPPPDLAALRVEYGLPDCPDTDPAAEQVDGGLPHTQLTCLGSDKTVNLAGLERTPTIINVWAQWCGPCREEAPFLREGLAELDGVAFLGVDYNDPLPDWAIEFAGLVGWFYPHVTDQDKTLQVPLKIPGIPSTYFIDADGKIAGVHAGPIESTKQLQDLAARYLGVS